MAFGTSVPLPTPPSGWFDCDYAVLRDGTLGLLRTRTDMHAEFAAWLSSASGRGESGAPPRLNGPVRLSAFEEGGERDAIEVPRGGHVDRLVDERWLVVSARATAGENNAHVYTAGGAVAGTFALGDGIEHVRCAPDGTIWVGYFDEGVFAGSNKDGSWPVSSAGVARFSSDGSELWRFGTKENGFAVDGVGVADCYALTLADDTAWFCSYTDFPIVRVEHGTVRHWRNDVSGAKALAVDGDHVVLAGGYGDEAGRIALLRLGDEDAEQIGTTSIQVDRTRAHLLVGRGATLHVVGGGTWTRLDVATLRATLSA